MSYLPRVRIEKRGSEIPIGLTVIIYRMLLDNLLKFKKEDCVFVAIKFDAEITSVVNKCKVASILSPYVQVKKSGPETASCRLWHPTNLGG